MNATDSSPLRSAEWLRREYVEKGRSSEDIGAELGFTRKTVTAWLRRHGIAVRPKTRPVVFLGERYGKLIIVEEAGRSPRGKRMYRCCCDCGATTVAEGVAIKSGSYKHCDRWALHGHARRGALTGTYRSWAGMLERCTNIASERWPYYGGRGITVCERWRDFEVFLADMGARPDWANGGIDRIDPDGNYEPGNCRWATKAEQARNTRRSQAKRTDVGSPSTVIRGEEQHA